MANFYVTNTNDSGAGSLRQAIADANAAAGSDTILFSIGDNSIITLTSGQLDVTSDIAFEGNVDGNAADQDITIDANGNSRVFHFSTSSTTSSIDGLTITGGNLAGDGGGITNGSVANGQGENVLGAGIYNAGGLVITNSAIVDNSAGAGGAGAVGTGGGGGFGGQAGSVGGDGGTGAYGSTGTPAAANTGGSGGDADGAGGSNTNDGGGGATTSSGGSGGAGASGGLAGGAGGSAGTAAGGGGGGGYGGTGGNGGDAVGGIYNTGSLKIYSSTFTGNLGAGGGGGGSAAANTGGSGGDGTGAIFNSGAGFLFMDVASRDSAVAGANGNLGGGGSGGSGGTAGSAGAGTNGIAGVYALTSGAGTYVVDNTGDVVDGNYGAGQLTLREAINTATPGSTITFDPSVFTSPAVAVNLLSTLVIGPQQFFIIDGDLNNDMVADVAISGGNNDTVIEVQDGAELNIDGLIIEDGTATGGTGGNGAAGSNSGSGSGSIGSAGDDGGAAGGGIDNAGRLTITNSTIRDNTAVGGTGGIGGAGGDGGTSSNVGYSGARGSDGGMGGAAGGGILNRETGILSLSNVSFNGNSATGGTGGMGGMGGDGGDGTGVGFGGGAGGGGAGGIGGFAGASVFNLGGISGTPIDGSGNTAIAGTGGAGGTGGSGGQNGGGAPGGAGGAGGPANTTGSAGSPGSGGNAGGAGGAPNNFGGGGTNGAGTGASGAGGGGGGGGGNGISAFNLDATSPDIQVSGSGNDIADGDTTPEAADGTDLGNVEVSSGTAQSVFNVTNLGIPDLSGAGGFVVVSLTGGDVGDFSIGAGDASLGTIQTNEIETITVTFDPSAAGLRSTTLQILSDDPDESPFTFTIQGTGTVSPDIALSGQGNNIADGDATPSITDDTDFDDVLVGGSDTHTFTITNEGSANLDVSSIAISGTHAADFTLMNATTGVITPGNTTTFDVDFDPSATGARNATVTILSDDPDAESTFTFSITGDGVAPDIEITGNGQIIADGDTTPDPADDTDFGAFPVAAGSNSNTFTISNTGTAQLVLTSATVTGDDAGDFTLSGFTPQSLAPAGSTNFSIEFDPSAVGVRNATVTVVSSDPDEDPYTFDITGLGEGREIAISGQGVDITDGDTTPSLVDDTDFGNILPGGSDTKTFTITNEGNADLTVTSVTITGADAADFSLMNFTPGAISGGGTATFDIEYTPPAIGTSMATVTIVSDDADENPFTFDIEGASNNTPPTLALINTVTNFDEDVDNSSRIKVADIVISDDGAGSNVLSLSGPDDNLFEIDGTELFIEANANLDFEDQDMLEVTVEVDDATVGSSPDDAESLTITLNDINEAPSLVLNQILSDIDENTEVAAPLVVAEIVIDDDALGTNVLSLSGADATLFEIVGDDLMLRAGTTLDFETQSSMDVTVSVDDATVGATPDDSASLTLDVTDVNEPPSIEIVPTGTPVTETGFLSTLVKIADVVINDDALGSANIALAGPNALLFELRGTEVFLRSGQPVDFETQDPLEVTVTADDPSLPGGPEASAVATVNLVDVNEPPSLSLDNVLAELPEDADTSSRIKVADIVVTDDALGTNTLGLAGVDAGLFEIDGSELLLSSGATLDFESDTQLDVTVTLDDADFAGLEGSVDVALAITDVNEPPTVALLNAVASLPEDADTSVRIKVADIAVTDDAVGTASLGLAGVDAGLFEIDGTELFLSAGAALDFETKASLDVSVTVDDPALGTDPDDSAALSLGITDVNEPSSLALVNILAGLPEDSDTSVRIKVADIVITDDALGTNTLGLAGADAALFEIDGTELFLSAGAALDFETAPQLDVTVTLDDAEFEGLEGSENVALAITDVNEPPTVALLNPVENLAEDADTSARIKVADIDVTDDALGTADLGLAGADAALFEIDGTELFLSAGAVLDFETNPSLDVEVTVDDPALAADPDGTAPLSVGVTDVNEAPSLSIANVLAGIAEDADTGTRIKVADIVVTDDALGTNTLALIGADAARFEIDGTELFLSAGATLDFESDAQFDVTVTLDDADFAGLEGSEDVALMITDVNEPPTVALLNTLANLAEDADTSSRIKVADIGVSDDALGTTTLGLAGADAALFEIDGTELFLAAGAALDFETNPSLDVAVTVDDPELAADPDASAPLSVGVTDVNEAPQDIALDTLEVPEGTPGATVGLLSAIDPEGQTVSFMVDDDRFEIDGTTLRLKAGVALDHETEQTVSIEVTATEDGPGDLASSMAFMLSVTDGNEFPMAVDDSFMTEEFDPLFSFDPTTNDTDPNGDPLTVSALVAGAGDLAFMTAMGMGLLTSNGGIVQINDDGTLSYAAQLGFTGTDSFDYEIMDPSGATDIGTISVEVTATALSEDAIEARTVALLYEAAFDRVADVTGLNFWIDALNMELPGQSMSFALEDIAQFFLDSPEFEMLVGEPVGDLTDEELVEQVYMNVLDRTGDAAGTAFWVSALANPDFSRADLLVAFAESPENQISAPDIANLAETSPGMWDFV